MDVEVLMIVALDCEDSGLVLLHLKKLCGISLVIKDLKTILADFQAEIIPSKGDGKNKVGGETSGLVRALARR